jgi:hypothetical protein
LYKEADPAAEEQAEHNERADPAFAALRRENELPTSIKSNNETDDESIHVDRSDTVDPRAK